MRTRPKPTRNRGIVYPPAPEGDVYYAIGDIHGRLDCLKAAHQRIDADIARRIGRDRATEVYLGDYIDRGPHSKGVVDCLIARASHAPVVCLRGNHEFVMDAFLSDKMDFAEWSPLGGRETALSYGVDLTLLRDATALMSDDLASRVPMSHRRFLSSLQNVHVAGPYCFVHAGLRPGIPIERQSIVDMLWIRRTFLEFPGDFGRIVVHGHTPVAEVQFMPNRINVDTGAFLTNRLSVLRIDCNGASLV